MVPVILAYEFLKNIWGRRWYSSMGMGFRPYWILNTPYDPEGRRIWVVQLRTSGCIPGRALVGHVPNPVPTTFRAHYRLEHRLRNAVSV